MNPGSSLNRVLVARIATKKELQDCPDMIACRYHGNQGEQMDDLALAARGPDLVHFNGKRRVVDQGVESYITVPVWPVYIKHGGECVIPNTVENIAYLDKLQARDRYDTSLSASGHLVVTAKGALPPLFVRLDTEGEETGLGIAGLKSEELGRTATLLLAEMRKRGILPKELGEADATGEPEPKAPQAPALKPNKADIEARVVRANALRTQLADAQYDLQTANDIIASNADEAEKAEAKKKGEGFRQEIAGLEKEIAELEAQ